MSLDTILSRLDKLKRTGQGRYIACCPSHADKRPSMTIRELDDGRVLIHCFGGCDTESILSAMGLEFSDLFPESVTSHGKSERKPFNAYDVLACVRFEARITALAAIDLSKGKPLAEQDKARLMLAASRLNEACEVSGV